jgi:hypothetical protein
MSLNEQEHSAENQQLHSRQVRTVYLVTYSQVDSTCAQSREEFAKLLVEGFEKTSEKSNNVIQWVCSKEPHKTSGFHYHMAIKLSKARRWLSVRRWMDNRHGIKVNFSCVHSNYYSAWKYTTKQDVSFIQSPGHPDLTNSKASTAKSSKQKKKKAT